MKKGLKWLGIIFAALVVLGMFLPDTPETAPTEDLTTSVQEIVDEPITDVEQTSAGSERDPVLPTEDSTSTSDMGTTSEEETSSTAPDMPDAPAIPATSSFSVHFIDVGQADAALVACDGHYMLIDGGNKADSNVIYSVLKKAAVPKLDIVVGTHAHEDHIGGLPGAFNYTSADLTLCPVENYDSAAFEDFAKYAEQKGGGIKIPVKGSTYPLGSATITILGLNGGSDTNDTSIVLRIDYGQTSFLFTGDAERDAEQTLLAAGANLSATVLKVGHHGSATSTTYPFLREIMPQYAVISVGTGNSYGHPTEDTLSRLRDAGTTVYRTDLQGDVFCTSDGKTVSFDVTRNADADTIGIQKDPAPAEPQAEITTPEPVVPPIETVTPGSSYIGNRNSKKFHETWCGSVSNMKESNKYYFTGTRDEIIAQGYVPCKNCNP